MSGVDSPPDKEIELPKEACEDDKEVELQDFVRETAGVPMNFWAVAALLESRGLRDVDAKEQYGRRSIFDLAMTVFGALLSPDAAAASSEEEEKEKDSWLSQTLNFVRLYAKGMIFAMPMAGQIAAILVLRYSLWAWLEFSVMQASLVAMGTIASFVVSGGIVQAIGREGTFYQGQRNPILLDRVCRTLLFSGMVLMLAVAVITVCVNTIFPYFDYSQLMVVLLYFLLLTPLWLLLAILYMLRDNLAILCSTLIGTAIVHLVMSVLGWGIYAAHGFGLVVASLSAGAWGWWRLHRMKKKADPKNELARLPRPAILLHIIKPFLVYGTLYFSFLFVDRIVAWSASDYRLPLIIWFRTAYELGMDWALLSLVLTFAVLEYTVHQFNQLLIPIQQDFKGHDFRGHNHYFWRFYKRQNLILLVVGLISIVLTYWSILQLRRFEEIQEVRDFFASPITYFVYWCAALGYLLLAFALLNGLFLFSLARPIYVIRSIIWGFAVNIVCGFILSRLIAFEYAVLGLIAGSAVFALLAHREIRHVLRHLDYYYYSAF